jgi:hypothetical protein
MAIIAPSRDSRKGRFSGKMPGSVIRALWGMPQEGGVQGTRRLPNGAKPAIGIVSKIPAETPEVLAQRQPAA